MPRIDAAQKIAWSVLLVVAAGCGGNESQFPPNRVYLKKQELAAQIELTERQRHDIEETLQYLFGTADEPQVPRLDGVELSQVLQLDKLQAAAGPVSSDQAGRHYGLYRKHCAHCHGLSGDGAGPSAVFLDPYPRDFRRGIFKYKATPGGLAPPTDDDLIQAIRNGNPGSAMPSFALLTDDEIESLVCYVKYLAIRGEVERALIFEAIDQLEDEYDRLIDLSLRKRDEEKFEAQIRPILALVRGVVQRWHDAPGEVTPVPPPPANWDSPEAIRRGRDLFAGKVANCAKCHGLTGRGDGENVDYDDWAREIVDPQNPAAVKPYLARGALAPRLARPRNLAHGLYRGGSRPEDLYRRIVNGIAGTPMPAIPLRPADAKPEDQRLTPADVWHVVVYVLWLAETPEVAVDQQPTSSAGSTASYSGRRCYGLYWPGMGNG